MFDLLVVRLDIFKKILISKDLVTASNNQESVCNAQNTVKIVKLGKIFGRHDVNSAIRNSGFIFQSHFIFTTMKANLHLLLAHFLFVSAIILSSKCRPNENEIARPLPFLIVLGEDLSGSFKNYKPLTTTDLQNICQYVDATGRGGRVALVIIGNPSPNDYAVCDLDSLPRLPANPVVSERNQYRYTVAEIRARNQQETTKFIAQCQLLLGKRSHRYTDINAFFRQAGDLMQQPGMQYAEKWIYVNSDGKQSTLRDNKLDCDAKPTDTKFFVSGWQQNDCPTTGTFLSPSLFTAYLRSEVTIALKNASKKR